MSPGSVSDSYDPEFGTSANAYEVREAIKAVIGKVAKPLGPELKNILDVVRGPAGERHAVTLSERQRRVIRFALNRALESI